MKKMKNLLSLFTASLILFACTSDNDATKNNATTKDAVTINQPKPVKRFGSVTGLKKEKMAYYKQLHAAAWPAVLNKISECNIQNYSIFLKEIKNEFYLFSYFEYTGKDFDGDMKKMAADTTTQRWWKETDPCQQPLPDAAAKGKIWSDMEEVFHH